MLCRMQQTLLQTNKTQQSIVIFLRINESWRAEKNFFQCFFRNENLDICGKLFLLPLVKFKN